jgi:hypothetical protein
MRQALVAPIKPIVRTSSDARLVVSSAAARYDEASCTPPRRFEGITQTFGPVRQIGELTSDRRC